MIERDCVKDFDLCKSLIDKVFSLAEKQNDKDALKVSKYYSKILYKKQHLSITKFNKLVALYNQLNIAQ